MERFPFASSNNVGSTQAATTNNSNFNLQEDPFSIELEQLDVLDLTENNAFMNEVIDYKKSLLDDAKLMYKLLGLDQMSSNDNLQNHLRPKIKKPIKKKSITHNNINNGDDDDDEPVVDDVVEKVDQDENKNDEEGTDEEEEETQIDDIEEDNDYMESYFDNGEEYIE